MKKITSFAIFFACFLFVSGTCLAQEKKGKEYHIKNRTLSEYYYQRIPSEALYNEEPLGHSGLHSHPWVVNRLRPFKNDLTNIIDSIYPSDISAWINTAWALMQMKTGIVPNNKIRPLAGALLKYWENPEKYGKLEPFIYRECGDSIANYLRVARTVPSMKQQMKIRPELTKLILLMDDFSQILLELAERTKEAVMPGYTHIRHAQPTTFGHYVLSVYDPIWRCIKILEDGYYSMSKNELGCGALA